MTQLTLGTGRYTKQISIPLSLPNNPSHTQGADDQESPYLGPPTRLRWRYRIYGWVLCAWTWLLLGDHRVRGMERETSANELELEKSIFALYT